MRLVKYFCDVCHMEVELNKSVEYNVTLMGEKTRLNCIVCSECLYMNSVGYIIKEIMPDNAVTPLTVFTLYLKTPALRLEPKQTVKA